MKRIVAIAALAIATTAISTPASATWWLKPPMCKTNCTSTSTTSSGGSTTTTSGGSTTSTTSGGSTSGTQVPEPGMLGLFGAGLLAIGYANRRRRRTAN